jgi:hypothetical protein
LSDLDAYGNEMGRFSRLNDRELDRVLAGHGPGDDGDLDELAAFFRELNVVLQEAPDGSTETRHLNAILDAVRVLPTADAPPLAASAVRRPVFRRRGAWSGRTSRAARVAFAGVLALSAFCGVAYAGALPGPVQGAVADVARNVGVSLPGAHNNKDDGAQNDKHDGAQNNAPTGTQTDTNTATENGGQGGQGTQNNGHDTGAQQNDNNGAQNGNSGAGHNGNQGGTNGDSGNNGPNSQGAGPQGSIGVTPPQADPGGANLSDPNQGNGDN